MVLKAMATGFFSSYRVGENLHYSVVQFTDGTILLGQATWDNLWSIKTIIRSFELVSVLNGQFSQKHAHWY